MALTSFIQGPRQGSHHTTVRAENIFGILNTKERSLTVDTCRGDKKVLRNSPTRFLGGPERLVDARQEFDLRIVVLGKHGAVAHGGVVRNGRHPRRARSPRQPREPRHGRDDRLVIVTMNLVLHPVESVLARAGLAFLLPANLPA